MLTPFRTRDLTRVKAHILRTQGKPATLTDEELYEHLEIWGKSLGWKPHHFKYWQDDIVTEVLQMWEFGYVK